MYRMVCGSRTLKVQLQLRIYGAKKIDFFSVYRYGKRVEDRQGHSEFISNIDVVGVSRVLPVDTYLGLSGYATVFPLIDQPRGKNGWCERTWYRLPRHFPIVQIYLNSD